MYSTNRIATASIQPKTSFYASDGTGRDTYIAFNSGGILHDMKPPSFPSIGSRPLSAAKTNRPRFDGKIVHYHSDGTGRDNYITITEGGLCSARPDIRSGFWNNLRQYDRIRPGPDARKDYFEWAQRQPSFKSFTFERSKSQIVKNLIQRLTTPKPTTRSMIKSSSGIRSKQYILSNQKDSPSNENNGLASPQTKFNIRRLSAKSKSQMLNNRTID